MSSNGIDTVVIFGRNDADFSEYQTPAEKCLDGRPVQRTWNHFSSADDRFFAGTWEGEPGCWTVAYTENEYCRILAGRSVLRDNDGNEVALAPGDEVVIPAGFVGEWQVLETTRKTYVIYEP